MTMQIKTMIITPEMAEAMLVTHQNYRNPTPTRIKAYADEMASNRWRLSIIIIDEDGKLCDGQNRLMAVIQCGLAQKFVVLSGWPIDAITSLDNGQTRSAAQVVRAERHESGNMNMLMSLVNAMDNGINSHSVLNSKAMINYDKHNCLAREVSSHAKPPIKAAIHLLPFCRAILKYPERKADILHALTKLSEARFTEDRDEGLRLYLSWIMTRGFTFGGASARKETYLRCSRALVAYLGNDKIDKLYKCAQDPFEIK